MLGQIFSFFCPTNSNAGELHLPLGEGRGEGSIHRSDVVGYKKARKYFFTKQLELLLARLPHPVPLPEGEGVLPNLCGLKV